jgi:hypothetical protein
MLAVHGFPSSQSGAAVQGCRGRQSPVKEQNWSAPQLASSSVKTQAPDTQASRVHATSSSQSASLQQPAQCPSQHVCDSEHLSECAQLPSMRQRSVVQALSSSQSPAPVHNVPAVVAPLSLVPLVVPPLEVEVSGAALNGSPPHEYAKATAPASNTPRLNPTALNALVTLNSLTFEHRSFHAGPKPCE